MYSPKINEEFIPYLYKEAKKKGSPMTKLVNDVVENYLLKVKCKNCLSEINLEAPSDTAYCSFCDCIVFIERVNHANSKD